jgi:hypothetical protein
LCVPGLVVEFNGFGRLDGPRSHQDGSLAVELPRTTAEIFHRCFITGKTKPLLVTVADKDGGHRECVIKLNARLTVPPLEHLCEFVAWALGSLLGIVMPRAFAVEITAEFARACPSPIREVLLSSVGQCFGSEYIPGTMPVPQSNMASDLRPAASRLLAFDAFIQNPDRRTEKPNHFSSREGLLAFDHGDAFAFLWPLIGRTVDPALDPCLDIVKKHFYYAPLKGHLGPLKSFREAIRRLENETLDMIGESVPQEWTVGRASGKVSAILDTLRRRRDGIDIWLDQVEACMES